MTSGNSSDSPLNRALKLNEQLQSMRTKNVMLYDENQNLLSTNKSIQKEREGLVQLIKDLNHELEKLKVSSVATEKRLTGELRNMQASWDSLYEEHRAAEDRRERELRNKRMQSTDDHSERLMTDEERINQQAELLRSAVKKQNSSEMVSPMERKLHEIEDENKKLKSRVVRLQTKYREEKYKNENPIKEMDTLDTLSTESESSHCSDKTPSHGAALFSKFNNRGNPNGRPSLRGGPAFGRSTKNLWGRMTSTRNMKQNSDHGTPINLACSREE